MGDNVGLLEGGLRGSGGEMEEVLCFPHVVVDEGVPVDVD